MTRVRKLWALPAADRELFLTAGLTVLLVRLALWLLPFKAISVFVERKTRPSAPGDVEQEVVSKVVWAVKTSSKYIPKASCLTQAFSTQILLAGLKCPSELQIGISRNQSGVFEAHAWVTSRGHIIIGELDDLDRYTPLPSIQ